MITKLTPDQEKEIPKYIQKWVDKASEPMCHEKAKIAINAVYARMKQPAPLIIVGTSPLNTALLCALFWTMFKKKNDQLRDQFHGQLYDQLGNQLRDQLRDQLGNQLSDQLRDQLRGQLYDQFHGQLYDQLHDQFHGQLGDQLRGQLRDQLDGQLGGQLYDQLKEINQCWYLGLWWLSWCGWYDYGRFIGVEFDKKIYDLFIDFNSEVHFIIPYKGVAFISEKPKKISWKNRQLHDEKSPAVEYPDGYGLWCLNGIKVPDWVVKTPAEKITVEQALNEINADVQREIIRKIGAERLINNMVELDVFTDKHTGGGNSYRLMQMKMGSNINRKYLVFEHASMPGIFYAKPVPPECAKALHARGWILSLVEREGLTAVKDADILANLPGVVS